MKNVFTSKKDVINSTSLQGIQKVDALLQHLIDAQKIPGLAITVLKDGKSIYEKGFGYADIKQETLIDPKETIFRIASVSKPIAATALAHMVADGQIDLDTSFYDYVPYYPKKEYDFTIRQLASHTAGIRGYKGKEYGLNKPYSIKESIEIFKDDALLFKPETGYHYNSFDWVMISLAMQEVSSIPFEEYVAQKVLQPLGMLDTFPEVMTERSRSHQNEKARFLSRAEGSRSRVTEQNRSTFYSKNQFGFREAIPVDNFYKLAGGGYLSTTADIARLGQAYLNNEILDDKVLSQFLTSEIIDNKPTYYGLGWQVSEDKKGRSYYGHIGNGVGGYSNFFVYPKEQIVISILINCTNPNIQEELDQVVNLLVSHNNKISI